MKAGERPYTCARGRAQYRYTCVHPFTRETPDRPGTPLCDQCWGNIELYKQRHWNPAAADAFIERAKEVFPGSRDPLDWARLGHAKVKYARAERA